MVVQPPVAGCFLKVQRRRPPSSQPRTKARTRRQFNKILPCNSFFFVFILGNSCSAAHEVPGPGFEDETTPDPLTHCTRPGIEPPPRQRQPEPPASGSLSPLHRGRKSSCSFLHQGKPGLTQETLLTEHSGQADTTTFPVTDLKQQSGMQASLP